MSLRDALGEHVERRGGLLTAITETSVMLALAGGLFWAGQISNQTENIGRRLDAIESTVNLQHENQLRMCVALRIECRREP